MKAILPKRLIAGFLSSFMLADVLAFMPAFADEVTDTSATEAELVFTEVMFNPTYRENDQGLSATEDLTEYIEIVNITDHPISLKGAYVAYSSKGYDGSFKRNELVQHLPESEGYTLKAGEVAVLLLYNKAMASIGLGYDTEEAFMALYDFFRDFYKLSDNLTPENFYVLPRVESGSGTAIPGTFNLDNSATDTVLRFYDDTDTLKAEANYDASAWNRNNYSLNLMYTGTVAGHPLASEPYNVSQQGTPGRLFENQVSTEGMIPAADTDLLPIRFMEYNICATDSTQTHADGTSISKDERAAGVLRVINRQDPDILCLCEVNHALWLPVLSENLYGEDGQYNAYGYSSQGCRWDSNRQQSNVWDLYNLVLWKKDKFDLVDSGHFWCSATPDKANSYTWQDGTVGDFARCINWVILKDKASGACFFVLCQHIDAKVQASKEYSTLLITKKASELSQGLPVMMSGDWNLNDTNAAYAALTEGIYADARYRLPSPASLTLYGSFNKWGAYDGQQSRVPIDHCFVTRDLVYVNRVDVDYGVFDENETLYGSDHNATVYELLLNKVFLSEPETEPVTETVTEPETDEPTKIEDDSLTESATTPESEPEAFDTGTTGTDPPATDTSENTEETTNVSASGCKSVMCLGMLSVPVAVGAAMTLRRHRED